MAPLLTYYFILKKKGAMATVNCNCGPYDGKQLAFSVVQTVLDNQTQQWKENKPQQSKSPKRDEQWRGFWLADHP